MPVLMFQQCSFQDIHPIMTSQDYSLTRKQLALYDVAPDIEDYWPQRLLHIPTMTSYEKESGDIYCQTQRPDYNILSYTWGRWEDINH
jgi:hypothetical protein